MIVTEEDIKRHQELLDRASRRGERLGAMTKFMAKHAIKGIWLTISLILGGTLWFLWGYFSKLKSEKIAH